MFYIKLCVHKGIFPCQIQVDNYSKVLQDKKNPNKTAMRNTKEKTNLRILFKFLVQNDKSDPNAMFN